MSDIQKYIAGTVAVPGVNITSHPRCGDADRQRASDRIGEAYARGFLEKDEAEARRDAIARCTLAAHLDGLTADIPAMTRFKGASLPTRQQTRAEAAIRWWQKRQPWTSLIAALVCLMEGITPATVLNTLDPHTGWPATVAAITIPPAALVFVAALCSLLAWTTDL